MQRSRSIKNKVYKYVHYRDEWIKTNIKGRYYDSQWVKIEQNGVIWVKGSNGNGYAWDGCSPKFTFLDLIGGTPDGRLCYETIKPITYYASLFHDAIYQNKKLGIPVSQKECDIIFLLLLKERKFFWSGVYYFFVRYFGRIYGKWGLKKSQKNIKIERFSWLEEDLVESDTETVDPELMAIH